MGNLKEIVGIKNDQDFQTLVDTGTLTYDDEPIVYSDDAIYFTPDDNYSKDEIDALLLAKASQLDLNNTNDILSGLVSQIADEISDRKNADTELNNALSLKANSDASNITDAPWISRLFTGEKSYGDAIARKNFVYASSSYNATTSSNYGYNSGFLVQWGVDAPNSTSTDYQSGHITFPAAFKTAGSYSLVIQGKRKSEVAYRDATFITRNLTSTGFDYMWYGQQNSNDRWEIQWIAIGIGG